MGRSFPVQGTLAVALTAVDRSILQRCLTHEPGSWNDFIDRFLGLIYHVVHYTAHLRSNPVSAELVEDIAQEILTQISKPATIACSASSGARALWPPI